MLATMAFPGQVVPDLTWEPQEIIETDDSRFVLRRVATGTTGGPFLCVDRGRVLFVRFPIARALSHKWIEGIHLIAPA